MQSQDILKMLQSKIGSADWSSWQILRWQWYDTVRYPAAGFTQAQFFVNGIGSQDPNVTGVAKTLEDTNVGQSGQFGQTFFIMQAIKTRLTLLPKARQPSAIATDNSAIAATYAAVQTQLYNLMGQGVLQISLGQKGYFQIDQPLRNCPPGFGVEIQQIWANLKQNSWVQGSTHVDDVWLVTPGQMIEPQQNLTCTIDFPNGVPATLTNLVDSATPAVSLQMIWDGYLCRPVQ